MFSFSCLIEAVGLTKLQAVLTSEFLPRAPSFFSEKKKKFLSLAKLILKYRREITSAPWMIANNSFLPNLKSSSPG